MSSEVIEVPSKPPQSLVEVPPELRASQYYADVFYKSRLFKDVQSAAQAMVKIQMGRELGLAPMAAMKSLYVIPGSGKVSPDANFVASKIRESKKYDYRLRKHTDDVCEIEFFLKKSDGTTGESLGVEKFDKNDAKRAGTKNMDKFPKNMLFARCIMNGARFHCPDVMGAGASLPYAVEELAGELSYDTDGSVVLEAEVVKASKEDPDEMQTQDVLKSLLVESCKSKGKTLDDLAQSLKVPVSTFDTMSEGDYERYVKLLFVTRKS